jgi:hypothetical protein
MNKFPNSGALFHSQNRIHPKSPDMSGDINIDKTLLNQLMAESEDDTVKIKLSAWNKDGRNGPFLSLSVNVYRRDAQTTTPAPKLNDSDIPF